MTTAYATPDAGPKRFADELLADAEALLRLVAAADIPAGTPRLAYKFSEASLTPWNRSCDGLSIEGFGQFLDWWLVHDEPTLAGRPVIAVNVEAIAAKMPTKRIAATLYACDIALHEFAHSIAQDHARPLGHAPAALLGRAAASMTNPGYREFAADAHGAGWWFRYAVLVARAAELRPQLASIRDYAKAARRYGFGAASADEWLDAVRAVPDFMTGTLAEVAARPRPAFDSLCSTRDRAVALKVAAFSKSEVTPCR